jgi:hypothetical protein
LTARIARKNVACPDRGGEAEVGVVGNLQRFLTRRSNGMTEATGPKISSRAIALRIVHVVEDRRLDVEAALE